MGFSRLKRPLIFTIGKLRCTGVFICRAQLSPSVPKTPEFLIMSNVHFFKVTMLLCWAWSLISVMKDAVDALLAFCRLLSTVPLN